MKTFSVLVTDDQNCWPAVIPDICNLKPHVILHDCTCLKPSDYEDLLQKPCIRFQNIVTHESNSEICWTTQ